MEKEKIKFKYLLNFWKTMEEYPTQEDILYEITSYMEKDGRGDSDFSQSTLDFIFRNNTEKEMVEINKRLKEMKKSGAIIKTKETGKGKEWWRIKDNLFD